MEQGMGIARQSQGAMIEKMDTQRTTGQLRGASLMAAALALSACTIHPTPVNTDGLVAYPRTVPIEGVVEVEVFREDTQITLANHSAQGFADFTLWINERFQRKVESLPVGGMVTLSLKEFRDEFGEEFRAGGFFSSEKPDPVVKAEIARDGSMIGLVVIPNDKYGP